MTSLEMSPRRASGRALTPFKVDPDVSNVRANVWLTSRHLLNIGVEWRNGQSHPHTTQPDYRRLWDDLEYHVFTTLPPALALVVGMDDLAAYMLVGEIFLAFGFMAISTSGGFTSLMVPSSATSTPSCLQECVEQVVRVCEVSVPWGPNSPCGDTTSGD